MKIVLATAALVLSAIAALPAAARSKAPPPAAMPAVPVATAEGTPIPDGQLSDAARPEHYRLDLTVDPARERFSGKVEIDVTLARPAAFIDLHGRGLAMHRVSAQVQGQAITGTWRQEDPSGVARITFPQVLPAGRVTLAFEYDAPFLDGAAGMFREIGRAHV